LDHISSITDALGTITRISYDERQNPVALITPSGTTHAYAYDQRGLAIRYTQPGGEIHTFTYDRFGNLTRQTSPSGGSISFDYDSYGFRLTGFTDANNNRTSYVYDNNGRLTRITRPDGTVKEYNFGCCAGLSTKDENGSVSKYARDPRLLITEYVDRAGHSLHFTYDRLHRLTSVTDPRGSVTAILCNDQARTIAITDPSGHVIRQTYDDDSHLAMISDASGILYQYAYDASGRLSGYSDATGGSERYERDAAGRITKVLNGSGTVRSYSYSPEGLVQEKAWDGTRCASFTYDNNGNLTAVNDETGRTEYRRDPCGLISSILFPGNLEAACSYDPMGKLRSIRYPDGLEALYTYDTMGRITRISFGSELVSFGYDAAGMLVKESRTNGADTQWGYDANGSVTEIRHVRGNDLIAHLVYRRDANRNIVEERAFLPLHQEKYPEPLSITGNRIGQVVKYGSQEFRYDPDGNLSLASGGMLEGRYDPENRLRRVMRNNHVTESSYNALGQRTGITNNAGTRRMYYDADDRLLFETDAAGRVMTDYIYAGSLLVARNRSGQTGFYHFDKTGNTLCITGRDGTISTTYAYDTFGMVTAKTADGDPNPFTFTGQHGVVDDGDGLYLMKRRHYDAVTGRFIQRDPIGIKSGLNLYAYAGNNPVSRIDPEGTDFGITIAVITTASLIIGVGMWAKNTFTPKNNTIIRGLDAADQRIANPDKVSTQDVKDKIGPDPGKQVLNEIKDAGAHVGDKLLGAHPVFGVGYTAIKATVLVGTGQPGEGIKEAVTVMPGIGETAGAIKETVEAAGECRPP
jgi:RHS repeat-associated protein